MIGKALGRALRRFGLEVRRTNRVAAPTGSLASRRIAHLDELVADAKGIPGMLSAESGKFLYALCYQQAVEGDVVEIGSWQGYSTSFLARAVRDSGNGQFHAIDHFRGNQGKEPSYVVGAEDLSDLRSNFDRNMDRLGLRESIHLLDMPNEQAARELTSRSVRFLFVDGDHTRAGVDLDIQLFFPLLGQRALVVFDDFAPEFPGVVEAADAWIRANRPARVFAYNRTLVIRL